MTADGYTLEGITTHGYELGLFDGSTSVLPESRHQELNLALLLDSGIGSDLPAFLRKLKTIQKLNENADQDSRDKITQLLNNLYIQIGQTVEGSNFQALAFSALVHKIDGEDVSLLPASEVQKKLDLRRVRAGRMRQFVSAAKKKFRKNLKFIFQIRHRAQSK